MVSKAHVNNADRSPNIALQIEGPGLRGSEDNLELVGEEEEEETEEPEEEDEVLVAASGAAGRTVGLNSLPRRRGPSRRALVTHEPPAHTTQL